MEPVLCLDVGGTNTRVGVFVGEQPLLNVKVPSHELFADSFARLAKVLEGRAFGSRAVVAFPSLIPPEDGPVTDKGLTFDARLFASRFNLSRVDVLNDLEAGAYQIRKRIPALFGPASTDRESVVVNDDALHAPGRGVLIVYAGTGLGTSAIVRDHVFASEINRFLWTPQDYAEEAFAQWLVDRGELLTYDLLCSGRSIPFYYAFRTGSERSAAQISERSSFDREARETIDFFVRQLARYTAFCAQAFLTYEGIVLGGNIVRANRDVFMSRAFLDSFRAYAFRKRLARVPIVLDFEHDINLHGCAQYAIRYPEV